MMSQANGRAGKVNDISRNCSSGAMVIFCFLWLFFLPIPGNAKHESYDSLITDYQNAFPQIEFRILHNRNDLAAILPLINHLGHDARNVDYAHPENARITLIEAQEYRLQTLIDANMPSATLFRSPNASLTDKPFTCLITMNHELTSPDQKAASRFMYGLSNHQLDSLPRKRLFDNKVLSFYALDHEVFHCIDAFLNGPMFPVSKDPITNSYYRYRAEVRTGIFAHIRHNLRYPKKPGVLFKICDAKTINLLSWDAEHYSVPVLRPLHSILDQAPITGLKDMAIYSLTLADTAMLTAEEYTLFLSTIYNTLQQYGIAETYLPEGFDPIILEEPDEEDVQALTNEISTALGRLNLTF